MKSIFFASSSLIRREKTKVMVTEARQINVISIDDTLMHFSLFLRSKNSEKILKFLPENK